MATTPSTRAAIAAMQMRRCSRQSFFGWRSCAQAAASLPRFSGRPLGPPSAIRPGGAALGLLRDAVEELLDPPFGSGHRDRADQRQGRHRAHRVGHPGPVPAGNEFDRADVVAQRRPGEQLVGEAAGLLVGEDFLAQGRADQMEGPDRADAIRHRIPLSLQLGAPQRRDLGVATVVDEHLEDDLGRRGNVARESETGHPRRGYWSAQRCGSVPSTGTTSPRIARWSRPERTICSAQALAGELTPSGPTISATISKAVFSPSARASRHLPSNSPTWRRASAIFTAGSRNGRPCPGRTRSTSSGSISSRLPRNSPIGSGVWPWSKKSTVRPSRWSPEIINLLSGWCRTTWEGACPGVSWTCQTPRSVSTSTPGSRARSGSTIASIPVSWSPLRLSR